MKVIQLEMMKTRILICGLLCRSLSYGDQIINLIELYHCKILTRVKSYQVSANIVFMNWMTLAIALSAKATSESDREPL